MTSAPGDRPLSASAGDRPRAGDSARGSIAGGPTGVRLGDIRAVLPPVPPGRGPRVVALGGGHGLAASLSALRRVTDALTAVVTVSDDGGSSGRLRREFGGLPPGDLRKALAALCGDDPWGRIWAEVVQFRFDSDGELNNHALGNLLIVGISELLGDEVAALELVGRLLRAHGRVLPMSVVPLDIEALVTGFDPADLTATRTVLFKDAAATE